MTMIPFHRSYAGSRILAFIKSNCHSGPCLEQNYDLAKLFGVTQRTITRWITSLDKEGVILRFVTTTDWFDAGGNKRYRKFRRIFVKSNESVDRGAVLAANAVASLQRRHAPRSWLDRLCGRLLCAPEQVIVWLARAKELGWIDESFIEGDEAPEHILTAVEGYPIVPLLPWDEEAQRSEEIFAQQPPQVMMDRLLCAVKSNPCLTNQQLAESLRVSKRYVTTLIGKALKEGLLKICIDGRRRTFFSGDEEVAASQDHRTKLLSYIEGGPRLASNVDVALLLGCGSEQAEKLVRLFRAGGLLHYYGRGKKRILSIEPLSALDIVAFHNAGKGPVEPPTRVDQTKLDALDEQLALAWLSGRSTGVITADQRERARAEAVILVGSKRLEEVHRIPSGDMMEVRFRARALAEELLDAHKHRARQEQACRQS